LLDLIQTNEIKTLYVFELSRLGRSFREALSVVARLEAECGVIVWSLSPKK